MKKIISLLTAGSLMISITACGSTSENTNETVHVNGEANEQPTTNNSPEPLPLGDEISGEITVSCYDSLRYKNFLEEAAKIFETKYPGTKVNVDSFSTMPEIKTQGEGAEKMVRVTQLEEDPQSKRDYVNKTNTELMSGKGADILAMDVLPFYQYARRGQLENLKTYMDNDPSFDKTVYRANIFDALTDGSGMYILPIDYSFTYLTYDSSLLTGPALAPLGTSEKTTLEQLVEIGREPFNIVKATGGINMFSFNGIHLFEQMFSANYNRFVDISSQKVHFTDGLFVNLLNTIKEYVAEGYIKQDSGERQEMTPEMIGKGKSERFFFKPKDSKVLLQEFNKNAGQKEGAGYGDEENDKILGLLTNDKGEIPFTFEQAYGINANSKNKRTAWEFIKFLTSVEMQTSPALNLHLIGMPIHYEAFLKRTEWSIAGAYDRPENVGKELNESDKAILDSYVSLVNRYTDLIDTYFINDPYIDNVVKAEVEYFLDGSKTAEAVAQALQNNLSFYLNE